jgi:hypothetical protein
MSTRITVTLVAPVLLTLIAPLLSGCGILSEEAQEGVSIPPASGGMATDLGLGPGIRPVSFGPGDKGSPRVNPSGEWVAFVLDGYVAEKPLYAQDFRSKTPVNFGTKHVEWLPDEGLAVLGQEYETGERHTQKPFAPSPLFSVPPSGPSSEEPSDARMVVETVETASAVPGGGGVVAAVAEITPGSSEESSRSRLILLQGSEEPTRIYPGSIEGDVTSISVSPDERRAILAVQQSLGEEGRGAARFEIQVYRFSEGAPRRAARLPEGMDILGAPQWTQGGLYFVGREVHESTGAIRDAYSTPYTLYRVPTGSEEPEPVPGVGEDFVAASASVSPDGGHLAVVGRRNPGSPTNLYLLNLASETLETVTTNENMEIKTSPRDLTWYPDSSSVILVARSLLSGPEVHDAPARTLSSAFFNLYEVPVRGSSVGESEG